MSVLSFVQRVFPPPHIMTFPCVGVDISDTSLKYIQFERVHTHDSHFKLQTWGDLEIPAGVVERGNVHDIEKLAEIGVALLLFTLGLEFSFGDKIDRILLNVTYVTSMVSL